MQSSNFAPLYLASEDYLDCKSVELAVGGDLVQRRCWLKRPIQRRSDSDCSSSSSGAKSCDGAKSNKRVNHEKRKYLRPTSQKRYPSHYVLEYLDQNVEEVHAKLRKDWFCMDAECNKYA